MKRFALAILPLLVSGCLIAGPGGYPAYYPDSAETAGERAQAEAQRLDDRNWQQMQQAQQNFQMRQMMENQTNPPTSWFHPYTAPPVNAAGFMGVP